MHQKRAGERGLVLLVEQGCLVAAHGKGTGCREVGAPRPGSRGGPASFAPTGDSNALLLLMLRSCPHMGTELNGALCLSSGPEGLEHFVHMCMYTDTHMYTQTHAHTQTPHRHIYTQTHPDTHTGTDQHRHHPHNRHTQIPTPAPVLG